MEAAKRTFNANVLLFVAFAVVFGLGFFRVHMRVQSTLIGYQLGRLKAEESDLLARRADLQMSVAKLTTKEFLTLMANTADKKPSASLANNQ